MSIVFFKKGVFAIYSETKKLQSKIGEVVYVITETNKLNLGVYSCIIEEIIITGTSVTAKVKTTKLPIVYRDINVDIGNIYITKEEAFEVLKSYRF